ncbi:WYL domain-containing protein [Salirhabdus salicampi]|uniref:WYL domain-containing protein n=1 Tax=Salirhabdus salicampi TaxID=476102 RepID=UPI0020C376B3|nr:WYL domain-containing protein [Salirhabdus salicampi]MCP8616096.1 WYL domain-containing protein [Salirhabdus salicampi]
MLSKNHAGTEPFVEMIYCNKQGEWSKRKVKIIGENNQKWYGYCYLRKGYRTFYKEQVLAMFPVRTKSFP